MYSTLRAESPQARKSSEETASTASGSIADSVEEKRAQMLSAAYTEICWPTMERTSVPKGSPRETSESPE